MHTRIELTKPSSIFEIELFIEQITNNNPHDVQTFWDKFTTEQFSLEDELYLLESFEKLLVENKSDKGTVLGFSGSIYAFTTTSHNDREKGLNYLEEAKRLNNAFATTMLGFAYAGAIKTMADMSKARYLFEQAAAMNETIAITQLGCMYKEGYGVTQDYSQAIKLFEHAVTLKNLHAMSNLGQLYYKGWGVTQNYSEAKKLFEQAAEMDNVIAITNLGIMHRNGHGMAVNLVEAARLLRKSLGLSCEKAKAAIELLARNYPNDNLIQYHYVMALEPKKIDDLINKSPRLIGECILYDNLLTTNQKHQLFIDQSFQSRLEKDSCYTLLAEYHLHFAQTDKEKVQDYCEEALHYLHSAMKQDDKSNIDLANRLYYFIALQCDEQGNHKEAIHYCLKTREYIPAHHMLAHLLFVDDCGLPDEIQRHTLCLHWLQKETTLPTINVRSALINKLLNILQNGSGFGCETQKKPEIQILKDNELITLTKPDLETQIASILKDKEQYIENTIKQLECSVSLWQLEETQREAKRELMQNKWMLFFNTESSPTLPQSVQQTIMHNWLSIE